MRKSMISKLSGISLAAVLAVAAATAWSVDADESAGGIGPHGMGPGMMGGSYGGMGSGMMNGSYGGMGMMGMGQGMMGGAGMGAGMMGFGPVRYLDLSDEQRAKINKIGDAERKQHWAVMGQMMEEQNKLRDLYYAAEPDPKKVGAVYGQISKLRQQMLETHIQAANEMRQVLTKEQREQLREWSRGGMGPAGRQVPMGSGAMPGGMIGR
ncbi:MAG: Spy/CpxP family protein refolding chaperone [Sulfuricaulis sp.]